MASAVDPEPRSWSDDGLGALVEAGERGPGPLGGVVPGRRQRDQRRAAIGRVGEAGDEPFVHESGHEPAGVVRVAEELAAELPDREPPLCPEHEERLRPRR
jgi:hypothetical protein